MLRRYAPLRRYSLKPRRGRVEDPKYLAWIRTLPCVVQDRDCRGRIDPHHVGRFGRGRDNDYNAIPLCRRHYDLIHEIHRRAFAARFALSFEAAIAGLNDEYEVTRGRRIA